MIGFSKQDIVKQRLLHHGFGRRHRLFMAAFHEIGIIGFIHDFRIFMGHHGNHMVMMFLF